MLHQPTRPPGTSKIPIPKVTPVPVISDAHNVEEDEIKILYKRAQWLVQQNSFFYTQRVYLYMDAFLKKDPFVKAYSNELQSHFPEGNNIREKFSSGSDIYKKITTTIEEIGQWVASNKGVAYHTSENAIALLKAIAQEDELFRALTATDEVLVSNLTDYEEAIETLASVMQLRKWNGHIVVREFVDLVSEVQQNKYDDVYVSLVACLVCTLKKYFYFLDDIEEGEQLLKNTENLEKILEDIKNLKTLTRPFTKEEIRILKILKVQYQAKRACSKSIREIQCLIEEYHETADLDFNQWERALLNKTQIWLDMPESSKEYSIISKELKHYLNIKTSQGVQRNPEFFTIPPLQKTASNFAQENKLEKKKAPPKLTINTKVPLGF